jgi:hypothetical protein
MSAKGILIMNTKNIDKSVAYKAEVIGIVADICAKLNLYGKAGCNTRTVAQRQAIATVMAERPVFVSHFDTNGLILSLTRPERTSTNS